MRRVMVTAAILLAASTAQAQTATELKQYVKWDGPKLTPEEAIKVLTSSHSDRNITGLYLTPAVPHDGGTVRQSANMSGPWDWPAPLHYLYEQQRPFYVSSRGGGGALGSHSVSTKTQAGKEVYTITTNTTRR